MEENNNKNKSFWKKLPIKYKLLSIGILFGCIFLTMFLIVVIAPLMELGIIKKVAYANGSLYGFSDVGSSSTFWWPVGSNETTTQNGKLFATGDPAVTNLTSEYGGRILSNGSYSFHRGLDIAQDQQINYYNVIASANGKVIETNNNCPSWGSLNSYCGSGFGNYVVIDHGNNIYTIYAHMAENSVKVSNGENVIQGQVLGKIGSSGHSDGPHLHFQIDVGGYSESNSVDPLTYISADNPRPEPPPPSNKELIEFITSAEGLPMNESKTKYVVYCPSDDIPTVGRGITLKYNSERLKNHGIVVKEPYEQYCGVEMDINVLDDIFYEVVEAHSKSVKSELNENNIKLSQNQIDALTSLHYNHGNIEDFVQRYKQYGSTDALCKNWWHSLAINEGTINEAGLRARRVRECNLFVNGIY